MDDPWLRFGVAALATWRVAHLLAYEDGPWNVLLRLRAALGNGAFGHLLDCFYCVSLWVALPFAFFAGRGDLLYGAVAWLALSGGACLIDRARRNPVVMQPIPNEGENDVLLWPRTHRVAVEQQAESATERADSGRIRIAG